MHDENISFKNKAYSLHDVQLVSVRAVPRYQTLTIAALTGFAAVLSITVYRSEMRSPAPTMLIAFVLAGFMTSVLAVGLYWLVNRNRPPQYAVYLLKPRGWTLVSTPTTNREAVEQLAESVALRVGEIQARHHAAGGASVLLAGNRVQILSERLVSGSQEYLFGDAARAVRTASPNPRFLKAWIVLVSILVLYVLAILALTLLIGLTVAALGNALLIGFVAAVTSFVYIFVKLHGVWSVALVGPSGSRCVYKSESRDEAEEVVRTLRRVLNSQPDQTPL